MKTYILLTPLVDHIQDYQHLHIFLTKFISPKLRMHAINLFIFHFLFFMQLIVIFINNILFNIRKQQICFQILMIIKLRH